jgi:hypothetical protein
MVAGWAARMAVTFEKVEWGGWPNCYRISNGTVELIVTSDIGPRVMRYGFIGGQNLFLEHAPSMGKSGEPDFQLRGGHRVWAAPEHMPGTYAPDNSPVNVRIQNDVLDATGPVEETTGLQKQIVVKLDPEGTRVEVRHRIRNMKQWAVEVSPWALTMMAPGGTGITGFPPRGTHPEQLAPTNPLVMWAFTDLSDPRWTFLEKYLLLRQDPAATRPQKIGHYNPKTWAAYLLCSDLFVKRYDAAPANGKPFPDCGCSFETFTNGDTLELETLGPLTKLASGDNLKHVELWSLHSGVNLAEITDAELDRVIQPLI